MLTSSTYTTREKGTVFGIISEPVSEVKVTISVVNKYGEHIFTLELD